MWVVSRTSTESFWLHDNLQCALAACCDVTIGNGVSSRMLERRQISYLYDHVINIRISLPILGMMIRMMPGTSSFTIENTRVLDIIYVDRTTDRQRDPARNGVDRLIRIRTTYISYCLNCHKRLVAIYRLLLLALPTST